jgi:hypothetical protein
MFDVHDFDRTRHFSGSSQSTGSSGFTPQNPQERVHTFPNIIKFALPQHSPIFGQLPEVQMVFKFLSHEVLCISGLLEVLPSTILV